MKRNRNSIGLTLFIIWLFTVLTLFYMVQKPFSPATVLAVSSSLLDLLTTGWLTLLALGLGRRALLLLRLTMPTPGTLLILAPGLGLGVISLLTLALGLLGLFNWPVFVALSLLLTLVVGPEWLALGRQLWAWRPALPRTVILVYPVIIAGLVLSTAMLPPTDFDGLFYHLTAPKIFLEHQQISPGRDVPHFNFPLLMEMLFSYAMLLKSDIAAKLIHTVYGGLLTGLIYLLAAHHLHWAAGWRSVLVWLSMPMIFALSGWAYNDLALAYYQLAAFYALFTYYRRPRKVGWLILCGLFAGFSMGVKYTSFIGPLTIGLILLGQLFKPSVSLRQFTFPVLCRRLIYFTLAAGLVALPWYLKNYLFTGNPFYPFVFDGLFWDEFRAAWYAQAGTGIGWDGWQLMLLPLWATLGVREGVYFDFHGRTGPLFLMFLPVILFYSLFRYRNRPPAFTLLLIFVLAQYLFWMLGVVWSRSLWQARLLLPGLAALAPVVGWLWLDLGHLNRARFAISRFLNLLIGLVLLFNLLELGLTTIQVHPLAYLTGYESRSEYLTRRLGTHYLAMDRLNQTVPSEAVVLFLWEPRSYFCQVDCRPDSILDRLAHDQHQHGTPAEMVQAWREAGISHVLLSRQGFEFVQQEASEPVSPAAVAAWPVIEARYLHELWDIGGGYQLYQLR